MLDGIKVQEKAVFFDAVNISHQKESSRILQTHDASTLSSSSEEGEKSGCSCGIIQSIKDLFNKLLDFFRCGKDDKSEETHISSGAEEEKKKIDEEQEESHPIEGTLLSIILVNPITGKPLDKMPEEAQIKYCITLFNSSDDQLRDAFIEMAKLNDDRQECSPEKLFAVEVLRDAFMIYFSHESAQTSIKFLLEYLKSLEPGDDPDGGFALLYERDKIALNCNMDETEEYVAPHTILSVEDAKLRVQNRIEFYKANLASENSLFYKKPVPSDEDL